MIIKLRFLDLSGDIRDLPVLLFQVVPPFNDAALVGTDTLTVPPDLFTPEVSFDIGDGAGSFVALMAAGTGVRFRSQILRFEDQIDAGLEEVILGFVLIEPSPTPTVVAPATITGSLPPLPITSGAVTITGLTLALGAGVITATGTATHTASVTVTDPLFGTGSITFTKTTPVSYSTSFTLSPITSVPPRDRLINVVLGATTVTATHGGLLGPIADLIANIVIGFMNDSIRDLIESAIQSQIDAAVAAAIGNALPESATLTLQILTTTAAGLTLRPVAGLPGGEVCPGNLAGGSVRWRSHDEQAHLRTLRDKLIARSPLGISYLDALKRHQSEAMNLLMADQEILKAMEDAVRVVLAEFPARKLEKGRLSKDAAVRIERFLALVEAKASPKLASVAASLRLDLPRFIETDVAKVLFDGWKPDKRNEKGKGKPKKRK